MKFTKQIELTQKEKQAILDCVKAIDCEGIDCWDCPFQYNCGCMLETLREVAEEE